jgi:protein arginine kinase activator
MQCDQCQQPAVVHEVAISGGDHQEIHLCAQCAQAAGVPTPVQQPITQLLNEYVVAQSPAQTRSSAPTCPNCGLTVRHLRKHGHAGCPTCYTTFGDAMESAIHRAQAGATHHLGKSPRQSESIKIRSRTMRQLLRELDQAVASEQYERAAGIRDRLDELNATP